MLDAPVGAPTNPDRRDSTERPRTMAFEALNPTISLERMLAFVRRTACMVASADGAESGTTCA
jgi:hypothetical protein